MSPNDNQDEILTSPGDIGEPPPAELTSRRTLMLQTRTTLKVRRCKLRIISGPGAGQEVTTEKERLRVGTHPTNDVALEDRTVSRQHFEIAFTEKGYLVVDLNSTNGTFVDGRRVERAYLAAGATIRVGQTQISFTPVDEEISVEPESEDRFAGMIGHSVRMRETFGLIKKIAPMDVSVIIQGETGTGKELAARAIHAYSARRKGPLVVLECGAIPPNLIESEFFGHEKGAFTGAHQAREGAFERAQGGTIFLDEIGELRLDLQPKLLRVLENREVRRVGGNEVLQVDVRVIAATNRDLVEEVRAGNFREDLFFRLSVINIQLPPLRDRRDDIPHLVRAFFDDEELVARHGRKQVHPGAMAALMNYPWPGNIRELMNVLSHALTFAEGDELTWEQLPARVQGRESAGPVPFNEHLQFHDAKNQLLESFEKEYISTLLKRCGGNVSRAAKESGMHRKSIERLAKKHGLDAKSMKE